MFSVVVIVRARRMLVTVMIGAEAVRESMFVIMIVKPEAVRSIILTSSPAPPTAAWHVDSQSPSDWRRTRSCLHIQAKTLCV